LGLAYLSIPLSCRPENFKKIRGSKLRFSPGKLEKERKKKKHDFLKNVLKVFFFSYRIF